MTRPHPIENAHSSPQWTAVLLAGQRPGIDPLAEYYDEAYKALVQVGGSSMVLRVAKILLDCPQIREIIILAQDPHALIKGDAAVLANYPKIRWEPSDGGIATSLTTLLTNSDRFWPVMVTTADHVLLTPAMVAEFLGEVGNADLAVAVGERKIVESQFPTTRRTWLKFSDGHFSGANMFAFRSPKVLPVLKRWAGVEQDRKKGLAIVAHFGPLLLLRALTRTIGLAAALRKAGKNLGVDAKPVVMSQPEAVIDVDKPADLILVEQILQDRGREKTR